VNENDEKGEECERDVVMFGMVVMKKCVMEIEFREK